MKFGFITHPVEVDGDVEKCKLSFLAVDDLSKNAPSVDVEWSRDRKSDWNDPTVSLASGLGEVGDFGRVLVGLGRELEGDGKTIVDVDDPDAILVLLVRGGSRQVVYDTRVGAHVSVDAIKDDVQKFIPTANGVTFDRSVFVVAKDEDEARDKMGRVLMARGCDEAVENGPDDLAAWLRGGRKVKAATAAGAKPEYHPDTVYVKRGHAKSAAAVKK